MIWAETERALGDAQVSELHCNFLRNRAKATVAGLESYGKTSRARLRQAALSAIGKLGGLDARCDRRLHSHKPRQNPPTAEGAALLVKFLTSFD